MNAIIVFLVLIVLAGLILFGLMDLVFHIGDFLVLEDRLRKVDLIHVFSGSSWRTEYAINLFKKGFSDRVFFTGGWCEGTNEITSICSEKLALAAGIPSDKIIIDNTNIDCVYEEAERLKALIENSPSSIRSVIVISDPYHMRRVRWTCRRVLGSRVKLVMAPVPFEMTEFSAYWWRNSDSRAAVRNEYVKLVYYLLRYQITRGRLQLWLASFDQN